MKNQTYTPTELLDMEHQVHQLQLIAKGLNYTFLEILRRQTAGKLEVNDLWAFTTMLRNFQQFVEDTSEAVSFIAVKMEEERKKQI
ncbi:MAG: hypothetical protein GXO22_06705 [Aquificae bacterium]|nr:hypothetical protein [Aquificota bacterium]